VLWRGVVTYCQRYGMVATTADITGIAAWIKPGYAHLTLWKHIQTEFLLPRAVMLMSMAPRLQFLRVMSQTDRLHRRLMPQPHWYLWALGIDPSNQGRGIGDRLLTSGLAHAQEAGFPCYLETQTEENVAFYGKRGFEVLHETRFPGLDLRQWFMCNPAI
jgi:ribosomal protein S18 acetylase RimI-like enzyme